MLKAGRSRAGAAAAEAHTGALAGDQRVFRALFEEMGAAWAEDPHDLLELAKALALRRRAARQYRGDRPASRVMTCSGGDRAVAADLAAELGVALPALAPATIARLEAILPAAATAANPLDYTSLLWDEPEKLTQLIEVLAGDPAIGRVLVLYDEAVAGEDWAAVLEAVRDRGAAHDVTRRLDAPGARVRRGDRRPAQRAAGDARRSATPRRARRPRERRRPDARGRPRPRQLLREAGIERARTAA